MNDKWADYAITAKQYNYQHTHIEYVEARQDLGDKFGAPKTYHRSAVIEAIEKNRITFVTAVLVGGKWKRGEDVRVIQVNGQKYLRSDRDNTAGDNLGMLPDSTLASGVQP